MAYSKVHYVASGSTRIYSVPFAYIAREHVTVYQDGVSAPFTWDTPSQVRLSAQPPAGAIIAVVRVTPKETALVDFSDASVLTERQLDLATQQNLLIAQESADRAEEIVAQAVTAAVAAAGSVSNQVPTPTASQDGLFLRSYNNGTYGWEGITHRTLTLGGGVKFATNGDYGHVLHFGWSGSFPKVQVDNAVELRLVTPGQGDFSAPVLAPPKNAHTSGKGWAMVNDDGRLGRFTWRDSYIEFVIDTSAYSIAVAVSDENTKEDIRPASRSALEDIVRLDFKDFRYKRLPGDVGPHLPAPRNEGGIIAQQARTIRASWVHEASDGTLSLNTPLLLTNALQAIKELNAKVEELTARLAKDPV